MGNRTPDLYNAIVALSQLSYGPLSGNCSGSALILPRRRVGKIWSPGARRQGKSRNDRANRRAMHPEGRRCGGRRRYPGVSVLVLYAVVDVFLDLGHIVVVLAQVRGVLDKLIVFFVDLRPVPVFILGVTAVRLIIAGF